MKLKQRLPLRQGLTMPVVPHDRACVVIYIIRITMIMIMRMMKKIISNEGSNI